MSKNYIFFIKTQQKRNRVTCTECGETKGENVEEHTWIAATYEAPKTCSACGETEGEPLEREDDSGKNENEDTENTGKPDDSGSDGDKNENEDTENTGKPDGSGSDGDENDNNALGLIIGFGAVAIVAILGVIIGAMIKKGKRQ